MQAGTNPAREAGEDLSSILGRFQSWNGSGSNGNSRGEGMEGVREIPYDEVLQRLKTRRATQEAAREKLAAAEKANHPVEAKAAGPLPVLQAMAETPAPRTAVTPSPITPAAVSAVAAANEAKTSPAECVAMVKAAPQAAAKGALVSRPATAGLKRARPARKSIQAVVKRRPKSRKRVVQAVVEVTRPARRPVASVETLSGKKATKAAKRKVKAVKKTEPAGAVQKKATPTKTARTKPTAAKAAKTKIPARKATGVKAPTARKAGAKREEARVTATPAFREMLVRSVQPKETGRKSTKAAERGLRVSVRLTNAEERRLQQRAAKAGLTASAYLRKKALEAEEMPAQEAGLETTPAAMIPSGKHMAALSRSTDSASARQAAATPAPDMATPAPMAKSGWGDWITLLRNRFLASPARFAERA